MTEKKNTSEKYSPSQIPALILGIVFIVFFFWDPIADKEPSNVLEECIFVLGRYSALPMGVIFIIYGLRGSQGLKDYSNPEYARRIRLKRLIPTADVTDREASEEQEQEQEQGQGQEQEQSPLVLVVFLLGILIAAVVIAALFALVRNNPAFLTST